MRRKGISFSLTRFRTLSRNMHLLPFFAFCLQISDLLFSIIPSGAVKYRGTPKCFFKKLFTVPGATPAVTTLLSVFCYLFSPLPAAPLTHPNLTTHSPHR